jgi:hypothetical protein
MPWHSERGLAPNQGSWAYRAREGPPKRVTVVFCSVDNLARRESCQGEQAMTRLVIEACVSVRQTACTTKRDGLKAASRFLRARAGVKAVLVAVAIARVPSV